MSYLPTIVSAIIAFTATISAGIFINRFKSNIGVVCAFAAGFFIALSLFDLLPNILLLAPEAQISLEKPALTVAGGFFFLFLLDRVFLRLHSNEHEMTGITYRPRIGLLSTLEFVSHGFIEGLAIGISFQLQFELGLFVAIAVVSHDFCDGVSTLALMLNSGNSQKSSLGMLFIDAFAPVLGVIVTFFFSVQSYFLVFLLSFLAGSFLYVGAGSLLPDAYGMNRHIVTIIFFFAGFFLVLLFSRINI